MFIAISLVVIISMTSAVREKNDDTTAQSVEELQLQLEQLQLRLEEVARQQQNMAQENEALAKDPRLKLLSEIAALETTEGQRKLEIEAARAALEAALLAQKIAEKDALTAQQTLKQLQDDRQKAEDDAAELAKQLEALQTAQQATALQMVFTTLDNRQEMPYYFIVTDGKLWRIGPDDPEKLTTPNDDVSAKVGATSDGTAVVSCTPQSAAGLTLLQGDALTQAAASRIAATPKGRLPLFMVTPDSAEPFYRLREILKQQGQTHGFLLCEDEDTFNYAVTTKDKDKPEYEY